MRQLTQLLALAVVLALFTALAGQPTAARSQAQATVAKEMLDELLQDAEVRALAGRTIVVADLQVSDESLTEMGRALHASLQHEFINARHFEVVERAQLNSILRELQLTLDDLANPEQVQRIGQRLNADVMLLGELTRIGETPQLTVRVVQISTSKAVRSAQRLLGPAAGQATGPPPTDGGQRTGARVLLISSDDRHESFLREEGFDCERRTRLPEDLSPYPAVWFADRAAIQAGTAEVLARYVQEGGGLVTSGGVPTWLNGGDTRFQRPWLGIRRMAWFTAREWVVDFPARLLGEDLGAAPRVTFYEGDAYVEGQIEAAQSLVSGRLDTTVVYSYMYGDGRFYYQSTTDVDAWTDQPVLQRTLIAGLRWVMDR